jgi:predicted dehydrogenase
MDQNRREFLKTAAAVAALPRASVRGANDRIRLAGIGVGGRGASVLGMAAKAGGTEVVALCDVYEPRLRAVKEKLAPAAAEYLDYRKLLERNDLDAVVIGSPDHWHVPMTIDAIKAGKDVYVEKPVSHSVEEGERLEREASGSRQVVQVGYQQRSWEHFKSARDVVSGGKLGKVTLVLSSWYQNYLKNRGTPPDVDAGKLDWKRFLGSAPEQPFDALRYTRWRWFWDFGGGHLTDLFSHYCDVIHWYMGESSAQAAVAIGTRSALPEYECPDTITAAFEYPGGFQVVYNGTLAGSLDGGNIVFRGSQAMMKINRDGFSVYREGIIPSEKANYPDPEIAMQSAGDGTVAHVNNFLECVRSRKMPNADVKAAVAAARTAHLGNLAFRKGTRVSPAA